MVRPHHLRDKIHIAVIGGNGFIGRTLISALSSQENLRIWSLDKRQHGVMIDTKECKAIVEQVHMDVSTNAIHAWLSSRPIDIVIYLAGHEVPTDGLGETSPDVNSLSALVNTVNAYESIQVPHEGDVRPYFLYLSSCSVYGENGTDVSSEEDLLVPANYSGMGKMYCEDIIGRTMNKFQVPWCILRSTEVYGRKHYKELKDQRFWPGYLQYYLDKVVRREENIEVFSPKTKIDLVHVNYLCQVIIDCLSTCRTGIHNVASGNPIDIVEMVRRIQELYGEYCSNITLSDGLDIEDLTVTTGEIGEKVPYKHTKYSLNRFIEQYLPIRRLEIAKDLAIDQIISEPRLLDTTATAAMDYFKKRKKERAIAYGNIREIAGPDQFKYIRYGRFQQRARELLGLEEIEELEILSPPVETLSDVFSLEYSPRLHIDVPEDIDKIKEEIETRRQEDK